MTREERYAGVIGQELTVDTSRAGVVDDGNVAWTERVALAKKYWPQAEASDFERVGRRRFRDRASGAMYRKVDGAPLLQPTLETASCFFVEHGKIRVLIDDNIPETAGTIVHGEVFGAEVVNGRIIKA